MRMMTRLGIALGIVAGAIAAVLWSWTYTPLGRLDLPAALVARLGTAEGPIDMSPEARAEANDRARSLGLASPPVRRVSSEDRSVDGPRGPIPVRIYRPESDAALPFHLHIHGGGWWMGNDFSFDAGTIGLAAAIPAIIVSVDYRLAPEHPYPAGLEDCEAVFRWIAREGSALGGNPSRISVGGQSAGGNLAAALALKMRDEDGPSIAFQYLQVPATDLSDAREWRSYDEAGEGYMLTVEGIRQMVDAYVPDAKLRFAPYVSPLLEGRLTGLPPALVVTATFDPLRDQGEAYARRLEAAGVPVTQHRAQALHAIAVSPDEGRVVRELAIETLRHALHP